MVARMRNPGGAGKDSFRQRKPLQDQPHLVRGNHP